MPLNVLKWTSHKRSWRPAECRKPRSTRHRPFPLSTSIAGRAYVLSLRGKRFRLVSEPRKTAKRDFRFCRAKNGTRAITWKRGKGMKFPSSLPHPLPAYSRLFSRGMWLSFLVLCFETARKHLLPCLLACYLLQTGQNLSLWRVWLYLPVSVMSLWLLIRIFTKSFLLVEFLIKSR